MTRLGRWWRRRRVERKARRAAAARAWRDVGSGREEFGQQKEDWR